MATIQEGKAAPAFTLADAKGKEVSLADFAGRNVILYFYPRDDTPGCTKEACGFRDAWKEIGKLEAVVLGVSADGEASHQKFIAKYKLPFPLLSDPERKVMKTRSEEHTSELQSLAYLVCRLLLEKKKNN